MEKKRIEWLDAAKGIGIILVVLGHAIITPIRNTGSVSLFLFNIIYYFHMPFMIYLSGAAYEQFESMKKQSLNTFVTKKFKRLMCPYIVWSILNNGGMLLLSYAPFVQKLGLKPMSVVEECLKILKGYGTYSVHLWYLYALFCIQVLSGVLSRNSRLLSTGGAVLVYIIRNIYRTAFNSGSLYVLKDICSLWIWFEMGRLHMQAVRRMKTGHRTTMLVLGLTYVTVDLLFIPTVEHNVLFGAHALIKVLMIWSIIIGLTGISERCGTWWNKVLAFIGCRSFDIYILHQPVLCVGLSTIAYRITGEKISVIVGVVASLIVPTCLHYGKCVFQSKRTKPV